MANIAVVTVVANVLDTLLNGHYRHQQTMRQLDNEYRLEKARIEQDTAIECKKIDATLTYALKHLESQMEQSRQNFSLLVKNLDLELKNDKKLQQHISQLMLLATNPHENAEIRLMVLKETLPAMFKTQQQNAQQRHAVLIQQLQNPLLLNNNKQALLLN
ncbi:MAG: hypothetical protein IPP76_09570 [Moraxellaceae bacterium]|jgi:hypothetical protein|nr:hypothetical protein [Moraxellaceae bacterium]